MAGFVVPATLASPTDLTTWTGTTVPANAAALLRSCTTLVLDATKLACYDVDADGLATDPQILQALKDATGIQAAAWGKLGIDPLAGGIDMGGVKKSTKLLSGAIEIAGAEATAAAKAFAVTHLVPVAVARLQQQNLISNRPAGR